MSQAVLYYVPGSALTPGVSQVRASTATYTANAADQVWVYWPGQLHDTSESNVRGSTATYTNETRYPASE